MSNPLFDGWKEENRTSRAKRMTHENPGIGYEEIVSGFAPDWVKQTNKQTKISEFLRHLSLLSRRLSNNYSVENPARVCTHLSLQSNHKPDAGRDL